MLISVAVVRHCRKELILQYLCGLSSTGLDKDQMVVREFLQGLGSSFEARDPVEYLKNIQRMKGEWFNQQGRTNEQFMYRAHSFDQPCTYMPT